MKAMFFMEVCPLHFNTGAVIFTAGSVSPVKLLSSIACNTTQLSVSTHRRSGIYDNKSSHIFTIFIFNTSFVTCFLNFQKGEEEEGLNILIVSMSTKLTWKNKFLNAKSTLLN